MAALSIPAAAGAASPGNTLIEPVSIEYPNLKADANEVCIEGVISPRDSASPMPSKPARVMDIDGVI